ncbi:protein FAM174C [Paroedura picta]|uniref:protein FAM174C n=1 Tax=Paroedura picta TaxID=143630 RepID=UPI00101590CE
MAARLLFLAAAAALGGAAAAANETTAGPAGRGGHRQGVAPGPPGGATTRPPGPSSSSSSPAPSSSSSGLLGLGLPALQRALLVFAALAALALLYYLGGRVFRTRKPVRRKYGLLSNSEDNMEMASLESDEDTLFETRNLRR